MKTTIKTLNQTTNIHEIETTEVINNNLLNINLIKNIYDYTLLKEVDVLEFIDSEESRDTFNKFQSIILNKGIGKEELYNVIPAYNPTSENSEILVLDFDHISPKSKDKRESVIRILQQNGYHVNIDMIIEDLVNNLSIDADISFLISINKTLSNNFKIFCKVKSDLTSDERIFISKLLSLYFLLYSKHFKNYLEIVSDFSADDIDNMFDTIDNLVRSRLDVNIINFDEDLLEDGGYESKINFIYDQIERLVKNEYIEQIIDYKKNFGNKNEKLHPFLCVKDYTKTLESNGISRLTYYVNYIDGFSLLYKKVKDSNRNYKIVKDLGVLGDINNSINSYELVLELINKLKEIDFAIEDSQEFKERIIAPISTLELTEEQLNIIAEGFSQLRNNTRKTSKNKDVFMKQFIHQYGVWKRDREENKKGLGSIRTIKGLLFDFNNNELKSNPIKYWNEKSDELKLVKSDLGYCFKDFGIDVNINKYITEFKGLNQFIKNNRRCIIKANPGTGKSYFINNILHKLSNRNFIISPTKDLCKYFINSDKNMNIFYQIEYFGSNKIVIKKYENNKVSELNWFQFSNILKDNKEENITIYSELYSLDLLISELGNWFVNFNFIIDEFHHLYEDVSYRASNVINIINYLNINDCKFVGFSGTLSNVILSIFNITENSVLNFKIESDKLKKYSLAIEADRFQNFFLLANIVELNPKKKLYIHVNSLLVAFELSVKLIKFFREQQDRKLTIGFIYGEETWKNRVPNYATKIYEEIKSNSEFIMDELKEGSLGDFDIIFGGVSSIEGISILDTNVIPVFLSNLGHKVQESGLLQFIKRFRNGIKPYFVSEDMDKLDKGLIIYENNWSCIKKDFDYNKFKESIVEKLNNFSKFDKEDDFINNKNKALESLILDKEGYSCKSIKEFVAEIYKLLDKNLLTIDNLDVLKYKIIINNSYDDTKIIKIFTDKLYTKKKDTKTINFSYTKSIKSKFDEYNKIIEVKRENKDGYDIFKQEVRDYIVSIFEKETSDNQFEILDNKTKLKYFLSVIHESILIKFSDNPFIEILEEELHRILVKDYENIFNVITEKTYRLQNNKSKFIKTEEEKVFEIKEKNGIELKDTDKEITRTLNSYLYYLNIYNYYSKIDLNTKKTDYLNIEDIERIDYILENFKDGDEICMSDIIISNYSEEEILLMGIDKLSKSWYKSIEKVNFLKLGERRQVKERGKVKRVCKLRFEKVYINKLISEYKIKKLNITLSKEFGQFNGFKLEKNKHILDNYIILTDK